jgi:lysophospholipase L1-like esterase
MPSKRPHRFYRIATVLVAIIVAILFIEFGARQSLYYKALYDSYKVTKNLYGVQSGFWSFKKRYEQVQSRSILDPIPVVEDRYNRYFVLPKISGHTWGFNAAAPPPEPPDGAKRILCVGSSTTEYGYPRELQTLLNESAPGLFEVINAGMSGAFDINIFMNYALVWHKLKPDMVIIESNVNSALRNPAPYRISDSLAQPVQNFASIHRGAYVKRGMASYALLTGTARYLLTREPRRQHPSEDGLEAYRDILTALIKNIIGSNATPVLATYDYALTTKDKKGRFSKEFYERIIVFYRSLVYNFTVEGALETFEAQNEILRQLSHEFGLPLIETVGEVPKMDEYFLDGAHHSPEGNKYIAHAVAKALLSRELRRPTESEAPNTDGVQ